ncbi:hypothetical protein AB4Z10_29255 [Bosea sp. RAF48]|jgi:hypothetical protein|uniref:hypothetical protein n=1 Tax=Bosea sp. RAF48 TaxID=3237480 RepID=UPI003F8DC0F7
MTKSFEIRRSGNDWTLTCGAAVTHLLEPARGVVEDAVTKWQSAEGNPRSLNPTGPHPPFERGNTEGLTEKHEAGGLESGSDGVAAERPSKTIRLIDGT